MPVLVDPVLRHHMAYGYLRAGAVLGKTEDIGIFGVPCELPDQALGLLLGQGLQLQTVGQGKA